MRSICTQAGCQRFVHARGRCPRHYASYYTSGSFVPVRRPASPNPWAGRRPCPLCASSEWTLPLEPKSPVWRCVACHKNFSVAEQEAA